MTALSDDKNTQHLRISHSKALVASWPQATTSGNSDNELAEADRSIDPIENLNHSMEIKK